MADDIKTIELLPCGYNTPCKARNCTAKATTIARSIDSGGRPDRPYELCTIHAERERAKGREIIPRGTR
jgi:hypothetical protein